MTQFTANEIATLRAKVAALEADLKALREQKPVFYRYKFKSPWYEDEDVWMNVPEYNGQPCIESQALYAAPVPPKDCTWTYNGDEGAWASGCGAYCAFDDDASPSDHGANFCHKCGGTIKAASEVKA